MKLAQSGEINIFKKECTHYPIKRDIIDLKPKLKKNKIF